jgi:hypothetical protein
MASVRFDCPQKPQQFKHLQCLNFGLLNSSLRGSLHLRHPQGRFVACTSRQNQRCKEFLMLNALRVAPVVHQGALPITNPAHSQHQKYFGEPS